MSNDIQQKVVLDRAIALLLRPRDASVARGSLERVKGIEPSSQAWEAHVLPLNHTRLRWDLSNIAAALRQGQRTLREAFRMDLNGTQYRIMDSNSFTRALISERLTRVVRVRPK